MVTYPESGMGVAPIDARTGRERLTGQESSVFAQLAPGPRVAGPQGGGGKEPGDKSLEQVAGDAERIRGEELRRKHEAMQPRPQPTVLQEGMKGDWQHNPHDGHAPLTGAAHGLSEDEKFGQDASAIQTIAHPSKPLTMTAQTNKNAWDRHDAVPAPKATETTPAIGDAEMGKSAQEQIDEGDRRPQQPEVKTQ